MTRCLRWRRCSCEWVRHDGQHDHARRLALLALRKEAPTTTHFRVSVAGGHKVGSGDLVWAMGQAAAWAQRGYAVFVRSANSTRGIEVRLVDGLLGVIATHPEPDWLNQAVTIANNYREEQTA